MSSKTGISPERSAEQIKSPKRIRKKKKKKDPFLKIAGVKKVTLSEFTQKLIGCIAGQHVTIDNPWMFVNKDQIIDNIEFHEGSSEFLAVAAEIKKYKDKKIYMGYVPDDSKDEDDFYICTVEESIPKINELAGKLRQEIDERMYNALYKTIREWHSLGSEVEVEQARFKNNRPLIEVEVEAGYPISPMRKEFDVNRAQDRRDGYMELKLNPEERRVCVFKRRIDAYVQQAPQFRTIHVQTTCTYPANASTQYLYEIGDTVPLLAAVAKPFKMYAHDNLESITDMLRVNGKLNLYSEDYFSLIKNNAKFVSATVVEEVKEYMSFMDVDLCKEKMISDVVFHPMWTGTVAVAYNAVAPFIYQSGPSSQVAKSVHGSNIVLIWSCLDGLKPKLILNSPREVIKLAFCKFDENVLIGGLRNGQIGIWDLRNKLQQVEDSQILSPFQVKNRASMKSLMAWMKIVHDVSVVEPAAISDVKYSHKGPVTGINFVSPFYEFTKLGRLTEIEDDAEVPYSMQFLTGAEDGTVLIWDLMKLPQVNQDSFKPRKLKRLKQKPAALVTDTSPHAIHNLTLRPIYRIIIPREKKKPMSLTSCHEDLCPMKYVELNQTKGKKPLPLNERIIYKPVMDKTLYPKIEPQVQLGSIEGDFYNCNWEGQDFDSGEIINTEFATVKSRAKVHDGPLNTTQKNHEFDVTLTVGGRIFAFWSKELPNRPLFWRKASLMYTSGEWNISQPYLFTNKLINGDVETWSVAFDSKNPSFSLTFSSGYLTASAFHTLKQRRTIYGAADKLGCLRLFFMPEDGTPGTLESKNKKFKDFLEREVLRKRLFLKWQSNWNAKAAQRQTVQADDLASVAPVVEAKVVDVEKETTDAEQKPKEKKILKKDEETYIEKIIRRRKMDEEAIIKETIVAKKQLDTKELEKRRKPLLKLEEENIRKKKKQKQRLKEGETIFLDTVSSLFPDVMKEKPPPPPDAYASNWATKPLCEKTYSTFLDIKENSTRFIQNHPYNYVFDWPKVLIVGKERRELMTDPAGERKEAWNNRSRIGKTGAPSRSDISHAEEMSMKSSNKSIRSKTDQQKLDESEISFP